MAQLSRLKKNQELRDKIDLETVITTDIETLMSSPETTSSHAKKMHHPYKNLEATPNHGAITSSPVIDELLAEVKQYNMDNGDRVSSDTQINILKSLEEEEPIMRRNSHFLPMDEEEEKLGSTMKLPRTSLETLQQATDIFHLSRPSKINRVAPIVEDEEVTQTVVEEVVPTQKEELEEDSKEISSVLIKPERIEFTEPPVSFGEMAVKETELEEANIEEPSDDSQVEDDLDILEFVLENPESLMEEKPEKTEEFEKPQIRKPKKKKIIQKEHAKERMANGDVENTSVHEVHKKSANILNIILILLLAGLAVCAGFVIYTLIKVRM